MKKQLAYPRAFVHTNSTGCWALAWRMHPDTGNHWDEVMSTTHYPPGGLEDACDAAKAKVDHLWFVLGQVTA